MRPIPTLIYACWSIGLSLIAISHVLPVDWSMLCCFGSGMCAAKI